MAKPYRLAFELPGLPKAQNVVMRGNRYAHNRTANAWKRDVMAVVSGHKPIKPLERAHLTLVRHYYRTLDFDGLVASFKPVVDGLVLAGILKNDTWPITGQWNVSQEYSPKSKPFIYVQVEEGFL